MGDRIIQMICECRFFFPGYCSDCFSFPIEQHKDKNICRLSIELLDTEDTHSEDPVEVEVRTRLSIHFQTEILSDTKFSE